MRIFASGTLFQTHTLTLPTFLAESSVTRAHAVKVAVGGSATVVLCILSQFKSVNPFLIAPLGGYGMATMLEREGVSSKYCKIYPELGTPGAWVLYAHDTNTRTIINHNPLPNLSHEDFVSLLGPLLVPENYPPMDGALAPNGSLNNPQTFVTPPFDWLHFEGRDVKTTLNNVTALDRHARERSWRQQCVFSVDLSRKPLRGLEALIPLADIVFFNKTSVATQGATSLRTFLLALAPLASPDALLVANWGEEGAAILSLSSSEYFQSSAWVPIEEYNLQHHIGSDEESVRTTSDFYMAISDLSSSSYTYSKTPRSFLTSTNIEVATDTINEFSLTPEHIKDENGAQDAFVAGMIYTLGKRRQSANPGMKWRLDECLRFATELYGRKSRKKEGDWVGLTDEMWNAGWLEESGSN